MKDLLTQEQLDGFREGCSRVLAELLRAEGQPEGHKYCTESGRTVSRGGVDFDALTLYRCSGGQTGSWEDTLVAASSSYLQAYSPVWSEQSP